MRRNGPGRTAWAQQAGQIEDAILDSLDEGSLWELEEMDGPLAGGILDRAFYRTEGLARARRESEVKAVYRALADRRREEAQELYYRAMGALRDVRSSKRQRVRVDLLEQAVENGSVDAMFALGSLRVSDGQMAEGRRLFRMAANRGHVGAVFNMGVLTYQGEGGRRDLERSRKYFLEAVEEGHPKAAAMLAVMHIGSDSTQQDLMKARQYLDKAIKSAPAELAAIYRQAREAVIADLKRRAERRRLPPQ